MYKKYIKIFKLLLCVGIFVAPVCYLAAPEIIYIMYGKNWSNSIVCFQILSIAIIPQMLNSSAGGIFQALGSTKLLFVNSLINTIITIGAILFGVFVGKSIEVLSICVAIAYICHFITAFYMLIKLGFKYNLMNFIKDNIKCVFVMIITVFGVLLYPFNIESIFISLIIKCLWLAFFFFISMLITGEIKNFTLLIKKKI